MKRRIEKIMEENSLSASQFADKIGVPRSGLSHVLKGRNNPSLDYVLKIIDSFPDVDSNWLLTGKVGEKKDNTNNLKEDIEKENSKLSHKNDTILKSKENKIEIKQDIKEEDIPYYNTSQQKEIPKEVDKIVFFYKDGSFKEYKNKP